jgi:hypothetical protein
LPGGAEQEDDKPDRYDDHRAEQQVGPCPGDALPRIVLDALRRQSKLTDDLFGRDPEMGKDGADNQ